MTDCAESVRKLERLAACVLAQRQSLDYPAPTDDLSPQVAESLAGYIEAAEPTRLRIVPLEVDEQTPPTSLGNGAHTADPLICGVLVLEQFTDDWQSPLEERLAIVRRHVAQALHNAREVEHIPLARRWLAWRRRRGEASRRIRTASVVGAVALLLAAATFLIPATLYVEASGQLQPGERRDVYAPADALVSDVPVSHGQVVKAGDLLVRLRRPEWDLEQAGILGELQTAQRRLAAMRSTRTTSPVVDTAERLRRQELAAEEEQLKETIASAERRLQLITSQQAELEIRADRRPSDDLGSSVRVDGPTGQARRTLAPCCR
ncbi:MAG: efflux RND transporter periplasmic adaptor subunit [Pirellulales bacterium]